MRDGAVIMNCETDKQINQIKKTIYFVITISIIHQTILKNQTSGKASSEMA
jgi:hypothetical protein